MYRLAQKPILVTGATGFLASHCVKQLLEQGHKVRGTVRSLANKNKNKFLYELVPEKSTNLELVEADLLKPESWPPAVEGVDYILHIASPFVMESPKDENVLIRPAVEGTLNVLQAALDKGAKKVIVTSSIAAIMYGNEGKECGPEDWSEDEKCAAYMKSKLRAERAAWKFWEDNLRKFELATVNPSFIVGHLFTYADGASEKLIKQMLTGEFPVLPDLQSAAVDVRDVAEAHVKALFSPDSNGKRYIVSGESLWFKDIAQVLRDEFSKYGYKVSQRGVPNWIIKLAAIFSKEMKLLAPGLSVERKFNTELSVNELGIKYHPVRESIKEMAYSLIQLGAVPNLVNK